MAIVATCLQIPMLVAMLFVKDYALTEEEQHVEAGRRLALQSNSVTDSKAVDEKK